MVETKALSSSTVTAGNTVRKHSHLDTRYSSAAVSAAPSPGVVSRRPTPRLTLQQPAWAPAEELRRKQARAAVRRRIKLRGEAATMTGIVSFFAICCAFGIVYLAAYAGVAAQGRQIHRLQASVLASEAQHQILVQQLTQLSSAARIQTLAKQQGMILNGPTQFVTLTTTSPDASAATQVASAR